MTTRKKTKKKKQRSKITLDADLINLGLWLHAKDEYFSWNHKMRLIRYLCVTLAVQISQIIILGFLFYEQFSRTFTLHESFKYLKNKDEEKFYKLEDDIQNLAKELYKIDTGNQSKRMILTLIMTITVFVVFFYVSKAINKKLILFMEITLGNLLDGKSLVSKIIWAMALILDIIVKFSCMFLTCFVVTQSASQFDLLSNAFGIFILVEQSNLSCYYLSQNIENEELELTERDDFMQILQNKDHACSTQLTLDILSFTNILLLPPFLYTRFDLYWLFQESPMWLRILFFSCITYFNLMPVFVIIQVKLHQKFGKKQPIEEEQVNSSMSVKSDEQNATEEQQRQTLNPAQIHKQGDQNNQAQNLTTPILNQNQDFQYSFENAIEFQIDSNTKQRQSHIDLLMNQLDAAQQKQKSIINRLVDLKVRNKKKRVPPRSSSDIEQQEFTQIIKKR